jgi:glycosyltransferase involved in cell wall biosynthesis
MKRLAVVIMMKNESSIIERCLESVVPIADLVIITDTGSTDDSIIKAGLFLQKHRVSYKIYTRDFTDFSQNRNELLELAKLEDVDYVLMIDADEVFIYDSLKMPDWKENLKGDYYDVIMNAGNLMYNLPRMTYNRADMRYEGVTHEYLKLGGFYSGILPNIKILQVNDSFRRLRGEKLPDDIKLLERALKDEKSEALKRRYTFYLAQTYIGAGDNKRAQQRYQERALMGGWKDEVFYCYYMLGKIAESEGSPDAVELYIKAFEILPTRVESLAALRDYRLKRGQTQFAQMITDKIATIPKPTGGLFIEEDKYVSNANPIPVAFAGV